MREMADIVRASRVSLMVMIICMGLYNTHGIDARNLVALPAKVNNQSHARLLIESLTKLHSEEDIGVTRTAPGGPDPQHHENPHKPMSQSPPLPVH